MTDDVISGFTTQCRNCGNEFFAQRRSRIYCDSCSESSNHFNRKRLVEETRNTPRNCELCEGEYYPFKVNQRYCSKTCSRKAWKYERGYGITVNGVLRVKGEN